MRSLYLTFIYLSFLVLGTKVPFVLSLGYVWVDSLRPQEISYAILTAFPVSLVMGAAAVGAYLVVDRRVPPPPNAAMVLTLLLAVWVTVTTVFLAVAPDDAWRKWDTAYKALLFSVFLQFVIRSRIQIEAFLQVFLFSLSAHFLVVALKVMINGGGYGRTLGLSSANSLVAESSTLAAVCLALVPIMFFLRAHLRLMPRSRITDAAYLGLAGLALVAAVGTYARTAVVGMVVLGVAMWLRSRRKILFGLFGAAVATIVTMATSDQWNQRISTIQDYGEESSALGRILVWRWTLDFVREHPFGGGFNSYVVNRLVFPGNETHPEPIVVTGKAFHSVYFEVLGEHGWIGLGLFLALIAVTLVAQQTVVRKTRGNPELLWCQDLAYALQVSLVTILACGAFIGIAFQPIIYYFVAISASLRYYVMMSIRPPSRRPGLIQHGGIGGLLRPAGAIGRPLVAVGARGTPRIAPGWRERGARNGARPGQLR